MEWNAGILSHVFFFTVKGWIGPVTVWINYVNFVWNLPQSSIDRSTIDSESNVPLDGSFPLFRNCIMEQVDMCLIINISLSAVWWIVAEYANVTLLPVTLWSMLSSLFMLQHSPTLQFIYLPLVHGLSRRRPPPCIRAIHLTLPLPP